MIYIVNDLFIDVARL